MICRHKSDEYSFFFASFHGQYSFEDTFINSQFKCDTKVIDDLVALTSLKRLKDSVTRRLKGEWVPNSLFYKEEMKND